MRLGRARRSVVPLARLQLAPGLWVLDPPGGPQAGPALPDKFGPFGNPQRQLRLCLEIHARCRRNSPLEHFTLELLVDKPEGDS
jgi:hypothetical protein